MRKGLTGGCIVSFLDLRMPTWGVGLIVLTTWLIEAEAQPPKENVGVVEGTVSGPQGLLSEGEATVTLDRMREGAQDQEWSEEQSLQVNGYFLFSDVPTGKYSIHVLAEGFDEKVLRRLRVKEESTNHWDLKINPQRIVRGRIFKSDGSLLVNTRVLIDHFWLASRSRPSRDHLVTTDEEGRYELQIKEGAGLGFQLLLVQPGEGYALSPVLPYISDQKELDLRLSRGHTLSGVIRDSETQAPIPNLNLTLTPLAYMLDVSVYFESNKPPNDFNLRRGNSDAAGRYVLQGMLRTQIWPAFGPKSNFRFGNTWSPTGSRLDPLENWSRPE